MKKIILSLSFALVALCANAQLSMSVSEQLHTHVQETEVVRSKTYHRIYGGFVNKNFSSSKTSLSNELVLPSQKVSGNGGSLGWTMGMPASNTLPLYVETGIRIAGASSPYQDYEHSDYDGDFRVSKQIEEYFSVIVPISITYRYHLGKRFYVAPFVGFTLGGVMEDYELEFDHRYGHSYDYDTPDEIFSFDLGMQMGVNFDLKWFHVGFSWEPSLLNHELADCYGEGSNKLKGFAHQFNVTAGFVIQKKKKVKKN